MSDYVPDVLNAVAVTSLLTANPSINEVLYWIQMALAILSVGISVAYRIWKWRKAALQDGKISGDEIDELLEIAAAGVKEATNVVKNVKNEETEHVNSK